MTGMDALESRPRSPIHIRLAARWAVISLVIAFIGLTLASLQPPGWITMGLKLLIGAASAVGVSALLMWVVFTGIQFVFGKRPEPPENSSIDLL